MDIPPEMERLRSLLRGGRPPHPDPLSSRQLESLAALCDAFVPSAQAPGGAAAGEAAAQFYATSASMAGVPERFAGLISTNELHPDIWVLRMALWLMSTWYGTFALCGRRSLSSSFPYFRKLSKVGERRREEILLQLSRSRMEIHRLLFQSIKTMALRLYYQGVDEKNGNPSWKAIGYCGPDPNLPENDNPLMGRLYEALVDLSAEQPPSLEKLRALGSPFCGGASPPTLHCDAVVVGSGSGGGVVAGVLAAAGYRVIVLEKGSYFPPGSLSLLEGPSFERMYEKRGSVTTDDLRVLLLAGATVGGGSAVNWAACLKTPDHVLEEWRDDHGLKLFGEPAYREALEAVCARLGVRPSSAGTAAESLGSAVLRLGCAELGYPVSDIPVNAPPGHDCGWCHFGCKDGKKKSTAQTWLADMAASGNGVVLAGCEAAKITTRRQGGRRRPAATGVICKFKHGEIVIKSRVTVVACGALNTPSLLLRSGLKNPNIGRHLRLHSCVMAWGYFLEESEPSGSWLDGEKKSYTGELLSTMTTIPREADADGAIIQTAVLHPGAFSAMMPWTGAADFRRRMARFSRTASLFALARDRGSGCSRYYPKSLTYKLDAADERALQKGMERMLRILAAAGAEEVGTHHRAGEVFKVKGSTREELEKYIKRASGRRIRGGETLISAAHQMGSCRMGKKEKTSVVDEKGETWEVERLFLADSSVFPTAVGVNPMVTVQAIAYCTAQNVLNALRE